jgi:acyl-CoA synthetase (AMP-forming)/AMP-acid ligase II/thioesterase domain-containing protein
LTYHRLASQIERTVQALNTLGAGRGDRVAVALPQGAELAAAILSVSGGMASAPVDPTLGESEYETAVSDLDPKFLIVPSGSESLASRVAKKRGWPILELTPLQGGAVGEFTLRGIAASAPVSSALAEPGDHAVILPTSGTTSRPQWVPLTHRNICAAADNTRAALGLTERDLCLDVMPLFHSHGLVAGVLATLMAGGTVACTAGFDATRFFVWLDEFRPTWFTAVPAIHRAIVTDAPQHRKTIARGRLRFIRSASATLSPQLRLELEETFRVVVTESYGLTEAPQLTNTPLDARTRKIGSLGETGTSEIAIMDDAGRLVGSDKRGEIVCRGPAVMAGYLKDSAGTAPSTPTSWLHTGDQGFIDVHGHLYLTGRLTETINRGGDKIFPREVDEVLATHPAIAEAATFGLPDPTLGEEIAAAVVFRSGESVAPAELRAFVAARLAAFKVPRRVFTVASIPLGSTGKVQRHRLPALLGLLGSDRSLAPARGVAEHWKPTDILEYQLTQIWEDVLGLRPLSTTDDFFDLGGTSLVAARMMEAIAKVHGRTLHPAVLFSAPTVQRLARLLEGTPDPAPGSRPLTEVQRGGRRRPFVFLHGHHIGGGLYCRDLARQLAPEQPFFTLSPYGIGAEGAPPTIEGLAEAYLQTLRAAQPAGPYLLGGYSHGGLIAFEMARRLVALGERVPLLVVVDAVARDPAVGVRAQLQRLLQSGAALRVLRIAAQARQGPRPLLAFVVEKLRTRLRRGARARGRVRAALETAEAAEAARISRMLRQMVERYAPGRYTGPVTLFTAVEGPLARHSDPTLGWHRVAASLKVISIPGDHTTCITRYVGKLAQQLQASLDRAGP